MTHSIDTPFPPPPSAGRGSPSGSASSTANAAKDEARNVGQTAAQAGGQVASTAADQAKQVARETQRQTQDLFEQGRSQLREQATTQQHRAAEGLSALAEELHGMLRGGDGDRTSGPAHDLLQQATGRVEDLADRLKNREPADLLDEVRSFARRKPGTFLLGAALAGVVAGRLTRGVRAAHAGSADGVHHERPRSPGTEYPPANYVDPAPAYSGLDEPSYHQHTGTGQAPGGTPVPPPPYGTVPPAGSVVPPTTPAGWDDPTRRPGTVS